MNEHDQVDVSGQRWGSDYIADLLASYGHEFVAFNPGASFRGIEESVVNYRGEDPEVVEVPNEGLAVSIAHGYAKATGDPGLCILHDVVGTMNAAMSIYNAYIDRVPVVMLSGTGPMRKTHRRPWIDWIHTANVQGNIVREYTKWDDQPAHVEGIEESLVRAHEIAETRPKGPTYVTIDHELQETELEEPMTPPDPGDYPTPTRMAPDPNAVEAVADALVRAEMPVVVTDQVGDTREAVDALIELVELLGAPVMDIRWQRFNFPTTHSMCLSETDVYREADVILALDAWDVDWLVRGRSTSLAEETADDLTFIDVGTHELGASGLFPNTYSVQRTDLAVLADTALAVPALRDAVAARLQDDADARLRAEERYERVAERHHAQRQAWREEAADLWDETPISPARMIGEVWEVIEGEEWVLVNNIRPSWAQRLWAVEEYEQYIGGDSGGAGVGYGIGAAIGAALAHRDDDRVSVNLQSDGDLMQYLGALWTIGHYEVPLFTVMHNNASLHNSTNHRMELAAHRGRDASHERALVGTGIWDPVPDYAAIAEGMGVNGYGPVEDPDELAPALESAWADVRAGEPALVDVICQSR